MDEELIAFGDVVKTYTKDGRGYVEALGIMYGSPDTRDLTDDYFSPDTDYGPNHGNGVAATLNHRMPLRAKSTKPSEFPILEEFAKKKFTHPVETIKTDYGILARHVLELSSDYEKMVFDLSRQGKLRWSSGSSPHMVERDSDGKIKTWHIIEWAYTPTAAEPRLPTISPIKSLAEATIDLEAQMQQAAGDAATQSATVESCEPVFDTTAAKRLLVELELLTI